MLTIFGRFTPRIVASVTVCLTTISAASVVPTFETVTSSGAIAPGADGAVFDGFGSPILNMHGDVAFRSVLRTGASGPEVTATNNTAWFTPSDGVGSPLGMLAREGDTAPGTGGGTYAVFNGGLVLNDLGQAVFSAIVRRAPGVPGHFGGPDISGTPDSAIFVPTSASDGSPSLLARFGLSAPDSGGNIFGRPRSFAFNAQGATLFTADLRGGSSGNSTSIDSGQGLFYLSNGSTPRLLARVGDAVPGHSDVVFDSFHAPRNFADGNFAFGANLRDAPTPDRPFGSYRGFSLFGSEMESPFPFDLQGAVGGPYPGAGGAAIYGQPGGVGSEIVLIAQSGDVAPGTSDAIFRSFDFAATNSQRNIAFLAFFRDDVADSQTNRLNDSALYGPIAGPSSSVGLLLREGDVIPGTGGASIFSFMGPPVLNDVGQTAFLAYFRTEETSGPPDDNTDLGLFVYHNGSPNLIVRVGDEFEVDHADSLAAQTKVVSEIKFNTTSGGQDGRASAFNVDGTLAFALDFTDGTSGIFTASLAATLLGDYSGNGVVDAADYTVWADNFGSMTLLSADGNGNGVIDAADYTVWADNFGSISASAITRPTIPEPATGLMLLGMTIAFRRQR